MSISMHTYTCSAYIKMRFIQTPTQDSTYIGVGRKAMLTLYGYNVMFLKFQEKSVKNIEKY